MTLDVALFWLVATVFLLADNLVFIPAGRDFLYFGRSGTLRYIASRRQEAGGREVVFSNPLNFFQRAVVTAQILGPLDAKQYQTARRKIRTALPILNSLSWLGYAYLGTVAVLFVASFYFTFGFVLSAFLCAHACFWSVSSLIVGCSRRKLSVDGYRVAQLVAEALFVPAYCMNMSKRTWLRQELRLPALSFGLRQFTKLVSEDDSELYGYELGQRLTGLEMHVGSGQTLSENGGNDTDLTNDCLERARACLKS